MGQEHGALADSGGQCVGAGKAERPRRLADCSRIESQSLFDQRQLATVQPAPPQLLADRIFTILLP